MHRRPHFYTATLAGAGTGKTYALVENYLCALFGFLSSRQKKRPHEILALTFTEKAAHEMRLRVALRLNQMLGTDQLSVDDPLIRLSINIGEPLPDKEELKRLVRALPNAHIATFHGFCAMVLKEYGQKLQLSQHFEILSPAKERELYASLLRPIILDLVREDDAAIKSLISRFRLAGTKLSLGLIDSLLDCYGSMFEKGISLDLLQKKALINQTSPDDCFSHLMLIRDAIDNFKKDGANTQHAKAKLLDIEEAFNNLNSFMDLTNEQKTVFYLNNLAVAVKGNFGQKELRQGLVNNVVKMHAKIIDFYGQADEQLLLNILKKFHDSLDEYKISNHLLCYNDLLQKTRELLLEHLDIRQSLKQRFSHILIDEYQDTSPIQEDLIALLLENKSAAFTSMSKDESVLDQVDLLGGSSLFVVGDKKQSIYGFRGADVALFDRLLKKIKNNVDNEHFEQRLLVTNRRSEPKILELINLVARHTLGNQGYDHSQELNPLSKTCQAKTALWVIKQDDNVEDKLELNLRGTASGIFSLLKERPYLKPSDIAILVRRIKSAQIIKHSLISYGIDSLIVGGEGFFQQQEIVDILAVLKLVISPHDVVATAIVLRSPFVMLSDADFLRLALAYGEQKISLVKAIKLSHETYFAKSANDRILFLEEVILSIRERIFKDGLAWALDHIIDKCNYAFTLGASDSGMQKWANIKKLRNMFLATKEQAFSAIKDYYAQIEFNKKEPLMQDASGLNAISIMTIHQAKGLEFKVVVLADGESILPPNSDDILLDKDNGLAIKPKMRPVAKCLGFLPTDFPLAKMSKIKHSQRRNEEEELARLLYVALSRAKEELYISCSEPTFLAKNRGTSLLALFLRAFELEPDEFNRCCSIEYINLRV